MNISVIGLGLIGGSFAKAIKSKTGHSVTGYDINPLAVKKALDEGMIDGEANGGNGFSGTDIILIALYPKDTVEFIHDNRRSFDTGTIIIDLCGVKRMVCEASRAELEGTGVTFIGGHPMAGRERSGYDNSIAGLFEGASMILTPDEGTEPEKLRITEEFFLRLGFGNITLTTPEHHDEVIAFTSQLAHIVSSAYIHCPAAEAHRGFSAGSFADMTRVSRLNENMWTELFLLNSDHLVEQIDSFVHNLILYRDFLAGGDEKGLHAMLAEGTRRKERQDGK